jgi:ribonuclease HI
VAIYTDGSCNQLHNVGAWVAILLHDQGKQILEGIENHTTHQRMELTAITKALEFVVSNGMDSAPIVIYTDSQYAANLHSRQKKLINAEYRTKKNNPISNADLIKEIYRYSQQLTLTILKVKAHQKPSEIENLNIEADKRCRKIVRKYVSTIIK